MKINKYSETMPDNIAAEYTSALKDSDEAKVITPETKKHKKKKRQ